LSKWLVIRNLSRGREVVILGGLVRLDYIRNSGAAFGILQTHGLVFALIALVVVGAILFYARRLAASPWPVAAATGFILGGAVGNLVDRLRLGYVVDFIDLRWWPVFNLADSAIVIGVLVLALYGLVSRQER
ncbi:MAG: signal peptidase II, partial [Chloroflexota bacterium]